MALSNLLLIVFLSFRLLQQTPPTFAQLILPTLPESTCEVQGWVRAQDLVPGQIAHGDVRVKTTGPCNIQSANLGLRFMERAAVKFARPDVEVPKLPLTEEPRINYRDKMTDILGVDNFQFWPSANTSAWEEYQVAMHNKSLWILKEQERIAFDVKKVLTVRPGVTQDTFALLVPNTNYPPATDGLGGVSSSQNRDDGAKADAESLYEYYLEVLFSNGTTKHIPIGETAFLPFINDWTQGMDMQGFNVTLTDSPTDSSGKRGNFSANLTVWLPGQGGLPTLFQGSSQDFEAEAFTSNSSSRGVFRQLMMHTRTPQTPTWASSFAAETLGRDLVFKADTWLAQLIAPIKALQQDPNYWITTDRFNNYRSQDIPIRTPSSPDSEFGTQTMHVHIDEDAFPDFRMVYTAVESKLTIFGAFVPESIVLEESASDLEELDGWVPYDAQPHSDYWGKEGVVHVSGTIPLRILPSYTSVSRDDEPIPTHYLSKDARTPIFIEVSDVSKLQALSSAERDEFAPLATPEIIDYAEDAVKSHRYRSLCIFNYAGVTWQRKVVDRGGDPRVQPPQDRVSHSHLIIQGL